MLSREKLEALLKPAMSIGQAEERIRSAVAECFELQDNLTSTQARCTELLEETRALRAEVRSLRPQPFVNAPSTRLRVLFVCGGAIGGAAVIQGHGVIVDLCGALVGALVALAATLD